MKNNENANLLRENNMSSWGRTWQLWDIYLEVSNMPVQFRCLFPIWKFFIHYFETKNNSSNRCVLKIFASYYNNSSFDDLKDHEKGEKIEKQLPAIAFFSYVQNRIFGYSCRSSGVDFGFPWRSCDWPHHLSQCKWAPLPSCAWFFCAEKERRTYTGNLWQPWPLQKKVFSNQNNDDHKRVQTGCPRACQEGSSKFFHQTANRSVAEELDAAGSLHATSRLASILGHRLTTRRAKPSLYVLRHVRAPVQWAPYERVVVWTARGLDLVRRWAGRTAPWAPPRSPVLCSTERISDTAPVAQARAAAKQVVSALNKNRLHSIKLVG